MGQWTQGEMASLRTGRRRRYPMSSLLGLFPTHTRDEIVTAIDFSMRWPSDEQATRRTNVALTYEAEGIPMINGRPAYSIEPRRHVAMF